MSQQIAVIQYNAGNIHSVLSALHRLGFKGILTDNPEIIQSSDKVIFPGVGEARSTMNHLREKGLDEIIKNLTQPVLGICLGMQLLCKHSEENNTDCLGIIPLEVKKFIPQQRENVPHVGWNNLDSISRDCPILTGIDHTMDFYFVHSYVVDLVDNDSMKAESNYGSSFAAVIQKNNVFGVQFHPEKSHDPGNLVLRNFLSI